MILSKGQERKDKIMSDEMMSVYVIFGSIGGAILVSFIVSKIMDFIDRRRNKKHLKEHPEYFRLYKDFSDKANTGRHFYNTEIASRKRKVDSMLKEEHYWSQEVREQKMEEIEKLRREICFAEDTYKYMNRETDNARQKVVEYVRTHDIKWAGVWE